MNTKKILKFDLKVEKINYFTFNNNPEIEMLTLVCYVRKSILFLLSIEWNRQPHGERQL